MHHSSLLLCLSLGALVKCATGSDWCYTGCEHSPSHWGDLADSFCGDTQQSPIDIATSHVQADPDLHDFVFANFSSQHVIESIVNNGHTVTCQLRENVEVSGGGLNGAYSTVQFHFHWGDTEHHPGSEHTIDGHRYPMEMHIVSLKKGLTMDEAVADSEGIAVLGFFIDATEDEEVSEPWNMLTSYLTNETGTEFTMNHNISIDDLIGNVSLTKFYRYMGSLTTPKCNKAVVWTVFHEPISINRNLIERFPMDTGLTNIYRPPQALGERLVFASPDTPLPPSHPWCYDDHCGFGPSNWHLLADSHCSGEHQSPIDIETHNTVVDEDLDAFAFTKFDDKHAIKYITNTGHSVKCVLEENLVELSGGGLGHVYSTLQFHFHWGSASDASEGSEHTVDSKRYPMEMHIVNKRKDLTLDEALKTPNGLAVLGFFIEAVDTTKSGSSTPHEETAPTSSPTPASPEVLKNLINQLSNIDSEVEVTEELSIDDLLGNVNRNAYYRYNGSLTTPLCNEAVVWTVFKESVKMDGSLMMLFPTRAGYQNVFRPTQPLSNRTVYSTKSEAGGSAPVSLFVLLASLSLHSFISVHL